MHSITIVIPTRDRCDTLVSTLQSCVQQNYKALDILVVDNFSDDATVKVVASFADPRVRYVNPGARLAMSANWEFALGHVTTEYVIFLGDDDALLPNAVSAMMNLVEANPGIDAISWPSVEYGWPNCQLPWLRDLLIVPLNVGIEQRTARSALTDVISFRRSYTELPCIYKGLVRLDVVCRLRDASEGKVFHSRIPDVYFGIASCAIVSDYLYSYVPFTVNGASAHSNGTSTFAGPEAKEAEKQFLSEDNLPFHPALLYCPSFPILVTESLLQARQRLPALAECKPDLDAMVRASLQHAGQASNHVFTAVIASLEHALKENSLQPQSAAAVARATNRPPKHAAPILGQDLFNRRYLANCKEYGIADCFAASFLANALLKLASAGQLSRSAALNNAFRLVRRQLTRRAGLH